MTLQIYYLNLISLGSCAFIIRGKCQEILFGVVTNASQAGGPPGRIMVECGSVEHSNVKVEFAKVIYGDKQDLRRNDSEKKTG